jgi:hypothetical protein
VRKIVVTAIAAIALMSGVSMASPGPNGHNNFGLCTAYSSGSATGQAHKHNAPPFVALAQAADQAGNNDGTATADEIQSYCNQFGPGGK